MPNKQLHLKTLFFSCLFTLSQLALSQFAFGDVVQSQKLNFKIEKVASGLKVPWGMAALPNGDLLITERDGGLRLLQANGTLHPTPISGLPDIAVGGQGGLLDVAIHPDYATNGWVYLSYSSPKASKEPGKGSNTALLRARIQNHQLIDQQLVFKALPNYRGGHHFGSRIAFDTDNHVFLSIGDRGGRDDNQSLSNYRGKIVRLHDDGRIPADNPFVNTKNAAPEVWSWGHRNPQGMARHPDTGEIWSHEHGPRGGDELNRILSGQNYGWPTITFGINYSGTKITDETERSGMISPVTYWVPSIAPSGMMFVTGDRYPNWRNNILIGSMKFQQLHRVEVIDGNVVNQEILLKGQGRIRAIEQGSDGYIYIAMETGGQIIRLVPHN